MTPPPSPRVVVSTATKPSPELEGRARALAGELGCPYAPRRNVTVAQVGRDVGASRLLLVENDRLRLKDTATGTEFFFHPNLGLVRGLNIVRGERDLFAEATGLGPGDGLLDCTLGFASEATLGAYLVGESGRVVGLESVPELAAVTRDGLARFPLPTDVLRAAMRRVHIVTADYRDYLARCEPGAFDVVYFDPFFGERLSGSENSVSPLFHFGNPAPLDASSVRLARRVARRRVVIKRPKHEALPDGLGADVSATVTARKNRVQYDVLMPLS